MEAGAEEALIERCRRQDVEAFGKFVDAYQARVYGFVKRMVNNADEAADVTQEVFIRAFQSFTRFDGRSSVRTWLFRIANNLCIDRSRRLGRTPKSVGFGSDFEDGEEMEVSDSRWQPESLALDAELIQVVELGIA
jgi:RNA polymerase sigma-70 factor (ECF subfamily)